VLTLAALLAPPLVASAVAALVRPYHRAVGWIGAAGAAASLAGALALCARALSGPEAAVVAVPFGRIDALSALLALCISFVTLLASVSAAGLPGGTGPAEAARLRRLHIYVHAFAFTMLLAVIVQNVALMWVAIEATTIASALAIPLLRTRASVEASWKYLLVCSVGIALAFTGTILAYFDFVATAGEAAGSLDWSVLRAGAPALHPELLQLAFAFIVVGYGTKAGLAPMHTWLPDAHSEAPAPVSAMMSGVLLAVALYAIARWKAIVDAAVDPAFSNGLLAAFGLASLGVGTFSLVIQRHYKRMLAYSSVEHVGLIAIGLALGPPGAFAAWLHVVNHALAKAASFLLAGRVLHRYRTTEIGGVTGLLHVMPWTGALLAAAVFALVGLPPFGLFVSELLLIRAAIVSGQVGLAGIVLLFLLVAFISLVGHANRMLYGTAPEGVASGEAVDWTLAVLVVPPLLLAVIGLVLPAPFSALIARGAAGLAP
jgi:hydrogenase-4 component F